MSDRQVLTRGEVAAGLAVLGIDRDDVVLVHASLSSLGFLVGGAQSLYLALRDVIGPGGTLVMPSFTPQLCHPSTWRAPDLARSDLVSAAREVPAFDVLRTPAARSMGVLSETLRAMPGTVRSNHPHVSFVSEGPRGADIVRDHPMEYRLSRHSPLGTLWDLDAIILMLGTTWSKCTALHLAEYDCSYPGRRQGRWPVPVAGRDGTRWRDVPELLVWEGDFDALGSAYESAYDRTDSAMSTARIGDATCRAVRLRPLVRHAGRWLVHNRDLRRGVAPPGWTRVTDAIGPLPDRLTHSGAARPGSTLHTPAPGDAR